MWSLEYSPCSGPPHLAKITVPSLVIQSTGDTGVFPSDAGLIHESLGATEKALELIEGDHYLLQPEHARAQVADRIAGWVEENA